MPDPDLPLAASDAQDTGSGTAVLLAEDAAGLAPPRRSPDGRVVLTDAALTVRGQSFLLLGLERAELTPVRWLLWYLLGGLGLAGVMIAFLQNWLRTGPAMAGAALAALLLAYGQRGTNRLRLYRLGREAVHFSLPGEAAPWQRLMAEANRRIGRAHDRAAHEAARLLAAEEPAREAAAPEAPGFSGPPA